VWRSDLDDYILGTSPGPLQRIGRGNWCILIELPDFGDLRRYCCVAGGGCRGRFARGFCCVLVIVGERRIG